MTPARPLRFDGVWKRFRRGQRVDTLRDLIPRLARGAFRKDRKEDPQAFWALRDISLEIPPGKVLGIIGPNGSGKSTFLKVAAGIMKPDRGEVRADGKIGALIELAAGFHGELTGRENIFFQGAVMGLDRDTIRARFDEIVAFAGLEAFVDTPVKRYSSGMNARLGFSIAVHMDPDVLLVDEVLSVGDREFQAKAMERLDEMVRREIPVVIVSHQLDRILALADEAVLLHEGGIAAMGPAGEVVAAYADGLHMAHPGGPSKVGVLLKGFSEGLPRSILSGESIHLPVDGEVLSEAGSREVTVGILVRTVPDEATLFCTDNRLCSVNLPARGGFRISFDLEMSVGPGLYRFQPFLWDPTRRRELGRGPSALVEVAQDPRGVGRVNLKPSARLLPRDD